MKLSFTTATLAAAAMCVSPAFGQVELINDSFADGLAANSGATGEAAFFATNAGDVFDGNATPGELGINTGDSGRGAHTLFDPVTLTNIGDRITASIAFTTPETVGLGGGSFRFGLFDPGDAANVAALSQNLGISSSETNPAVDINGYLVDLDVSPTGFGGALLNAASDFQFRTRDSLSPDNGRLAGTTSGFTTLPPSGPDLGYGFGSNSPYELSLEAELVAEGVQLTATLLDVTAAESFEYVFLDDGAVTTGDPPEAVTDGVPNTTFGYLQLHINSNQFGNTRDPDVVNNGITLTNVSVLTTVPEPASIALLALGATALVGRRRKA